VTASERLQRRREEAGLTSEEYRIEKLTAYHQNHLGRDSYLVKWRGFPDTESTWQPAWTLPPYYVKSFGRRLKEEYQKSGQESRGGVVNAEAPSETLDAGPTEGV
jgi:hypothetical protein